MKNRVLLILLLSFAVSLAASAQKITMNLQQVKLEKVFSLITKQTGLTVAYSRTIVIPNGCFCPGKRQRPFLKYWMIYLRVQM